MHDPQVSVNRACGDDVLLWGMRLLAAVYPLIINI